MDVRSSRRALRGISDEDLWVLIARGGEPAFTEFHARFAEPLRIAFRSWLEDDAAAEDLTAETLARAWERRTRWRPRRLKTFLTAAARNLARDLRLSEGARVDREQSWSVEVSRPIPSAQRLFELQTVRVALREATLALPTRRRRAFVLTCIHGWSHAEVAKRMGIQRKTVERHVELAKAELRAKLEGSLGEARVRELRGG